MRIFIQALSLALFSLLFFFFANYKLPEWLPADIYLRLDPLLGLSAILSAREWIGRALWSFIPVLTVPNPCISRLDATKFMRYNLLYKE